MYTSHQKFLIFSRFSVLPDALGRRLRHTGGSRATAQDGFCGHFKVQPSEMGDFHGITLWLCQQLAIENEP